MSKSLVLQRLWNQLGCKEIMSMMNIVNVFTQHTDYLCMFLCKNYYEMEPEHCEKSRCVYHTLLWTLKSTKKQTWKSMVAEAQLCQSKLRPWSEGIERLHDLPPAKQ